MNEETPNNKAMLEEAKKCLEQLNNTRKRFTKLIKVADKTAKEMVQLNTEESDLILAKTCRAAAEAAIKIAETEIAINKALALINRLENGEGE